MQLIQLVFNQPFDWERVGNVLRIKGTLLTEGVWRGLDLQPVYYSRSVIRRALDSILGKQINISTVKKQNQLSDSSQLQGKTTQVWTLKGSSSTRQSWILSN